MKKHVTGILVFALAAGMMVGCTTTKTAETAAVSAETSNVAETTAAETTAEETTAAEVAEQDYKLGMAVVSSLEKSKDAKDADGNAQVDAVAAAVVLDAEGKIVSCVIDTAQTKMAFTAEGKVVTQEEFKTKKELADEYGMKAASTIGKEWYEQIAVLEDYVIGKTVEEIEGISVNEDTVPQDVDLTSSVTIKIGDYVEAIAAAAADAKVLGTQPEDSLRLGIVTDMNKSKDAEEGKDGQCEAYSTYVALTADADGVITASVIDCTQGTVTFDQSGVITADLSAGVKTKRQLGDEYGMKAASGIGKEWYEQAQAFSEYLVGKTAEEVAGIAVDEGNYPTAEDLVASVTIAIGDYTTAVEKALK